MVLYSERTSESSNASSVLRACIKCNTTGWSHRVAADRCIVVAWWVRRPMPVLGWRGPPHREGRRDRRSGLAAPLDSGRAVRSGGFFRL